MCLELRGQFYGVEFRLPLLHGLQGSNLLSTLLVPRVLIYSLSLFNKARLLAQEI